MQPPSDDELDAFVLTRMKLLGVDLSVLPEDDPSAPADLRRILTSARSFLRSTPEVLQGLPYTHEGTVPALYPSANVPVADPGEGG